MDAVSRTFFLILKKVAFNQAVFSGRKIIPQTSKPGSDTNMAPGQKDRTVPIPEALMDELRAQLERLIDLYERDCEEGCDGVFLYGLLEKKYKNTSRELIWQWFFPAKELTFIPENKERRRYHILNPQWANTRFAPTAF
jgi:integrase